MICPACKSDMIVVEHSQIELDYCTDCRGVWFDSGELELLLESMGLENPDLFLGNLLSLSRFLSNCCCSTGSSLVLGSRHSVTNRIY